MKKPTAGVWLLVAALMAFLAAAVWAAADAWISMGATASRAEAVGITGDMGFHGIMALIIGGIGTLVIGVVLMALIFYSSRNNYDR